MANGLYLRLSIADGDLGKENKDESNSIDNQRSLLVNFITDREDMSDEYIEYVDDGYSGTNFDRPAFKKMIEDAKARKIDTVIVKDAYLSAHPTLLVRYGTVSLLCTKTVSVFL